MNRHTLPGIPGSKPHKLHTFNDIRKSAQASDTQASDTQFTSLTEERKAELLSLADTVARARIVEVQKSNQKAQARSNISFPVVHRSETPFDKEFSIARMVKSLIAHDKSCAELEWEMVGQDFEVVKALGNTSAGAGGIVVPTVTSDSIIAYLEQAEVVRGLGADVFPMPTDKLDVPVDEGGVTAYYVTQNEDGSETDMQFGLRTFVVHDMMALCPISNSWLSDISPAIERTVRNRISRSIAVREDLSYLRGTGVGEPQGLLNTSAVPYATSKALSALSFDDLIDLTGSIEAANATPTGWAMHPDVRTTMAKLTDDNGRYLWMENPANPVGRTFQGLPVRMTTALKYTSGGTTYYPLICGMWNHALIGQRQGIEIAASDQVRFLRNQTVIRAMFRHDFKIGQVSAFKYILLTA